MKRFVIILCIMFLFVGIVSAKSYKNEPDGFRGIKWGTKMDDHKNIMTFEKRESGFGGVDIYTKNNDDLVIGSAKLETIKYAFWQDKLMFVCIITSSYSNWTGLLNSLNEKFGQGFQENEFIEKYVWIGDKTIIIAELNEINNVGTFYFTSTEMYTKAKEWEKEKAMDGANNGF